MHAILKNNQIFIFDSFIHKESIKQITGRIWHPDDKAWSVPMTLESLETLDLLGCELSSELRAMKKNYIQEEASVSEALISPPLKVTPLNIGNISLCFSKSEYEHQLRWYNLACRSMEIISDDIVSHGFALLMEMGTGMTITSIAIAGRACLNGKIKRLLKLAPKSIVSVWEEEFLKFADFRYSLSMLQGSSAKNVTALKEIPHKSLEVAIVN